MAKHYRSAVIVARLGNMRKVAEWTVCPRASGAGADDPIIIQSDKRIARVDLATGKMTLSSGKGGHNGFAHLSPMMGAVTIDAPADLLDAMRNLSPTLPSGPVRLV